MGIGEDASNEPFIHLCDSLTEMAKGTFGKCPPKMKMEMEFGFSL